MKQFYCEPSVFTNFPIHFFNQTIIDNRKPPPPQLVKKIVEVRMEEGFEGDLGPPRAVVSTKGEETKIFLVAGKKTLRETLVVHPWSSWSDPPFSLVYADKPQTLDHLEDNIRHVIADIWPQMLEKVIENWTYRLDYIRASRGSPMPEIFKM
ncbi:hypothetical protein TNCV_2837301 [Trichonephila clavipes]|nr:hypothetical protein TNCV_2837301 [Trichonephila clavipes]